MEEEFKKHIDNGDEVIGLFISKELSGTYNNALMAKNLIGSENVIEAHDQTDNGNPADMRYAYVGHQASITRDTDLRFKNPYPEPIVITARFNWSNQSCMIDVFCKAAS